MCATNIIIYVRLIFKFFPYFIKKREATITNYYFNDSLKLSIVLNKIFSSKFKKGITANQSLKLSLDIFLLS